jgi:integrase
MGYLYQVGKTWYYGFQDPNGKWIRRSARTSHKPAARLKMEKAELKAARGEVDRPPTTLLDFLTGYLKQQKPTLDAGTYDRYDDCLHALTAEGDKVNADTRSPLAGLMLSDVTIGTCSQYVSWRLANGKSKGTVAKETTWLKGALLEAARQDLASWEAVARIRDEITSKRLPALRKANRRLDRVLLPQEIPVLFALAGPRTLPQGGGNAWTPNLQDALQLAFWTGLRQENILELTEGQVDFTCEPAVIRFTPEQMKNDTGHLVRLAPEAKAILWRRMVGDPKKPERRFFVDFRPAWKRLQAKKTFQAALPALRFHDLRRSYVSYRLAAGIDPKTVQDEVGHRDSRMTMDCYGRALRDPSVRQWALTNFRFPWDPSYQTGVDYTHNSQALPGGETARAEKPVTP